MSQDLGDVAWPVTTARLSLRRARVEDADEVLTYRAAPPVAQWIGRPLEDFRPRFVAPERLDLLVVTERTAAIIGDLMIKIGDAWAPATMAEQGHRVQAELGWSLGQEERGHGYATDRGGRGGAADLLRRSGSPWAGQEVASTPFPLTGRPILPARSGRKWR